jgi:ribosomal protein S18 acetylase RimI-like enzyme
MSIRFHPPKLPWLHRPDETSATAVAPEIVPLTPALARSLKLGWSSRFNGESLARHAARAPGWAWTVPETHEYLVLEGWRRRDDVALVAEIHARQHQAGLFRAAGAGLAAAGVGVMLLPDAEWMLHGRFYEQLGFARLERIVYYQLTGLRLPLDLRRPLPALTFAPVTWNALATTVAVDHAAFPWLWWNSPAEFENYLSTPGVQAVLGYAAGQPVGYAGFTITRDWGHLDRLAVIEGEHGRGWGAALLAHALEAMARRGVTRVTLSTQETNSQSQRLYRGFGFRQTRDAHNIYGRWLGEPRL